MVPNLPLPDTAAEVVATDSVMIVNKTKVR